jgi:hypothetical protein
MVREWVKVLALESVRELAQGWVKVLALEWVKVLVREWARGKFQGRGMELVRASAKGLALALARG